jgi:NAD(P)H-flavin reductase
VKPAATAHPHNPWLAHSVQIADMAAAVPGVFSCDLVFEDPAVTEEYSFRPGQFNMLYLPGLGEIAISVSGDPGLRGIVSHTIREAGNVTRALAKLPIGSSIGLRGPFGSHWPVENCVGRDVVLVAGGIGLAPLRPVVSYLLSHREDFGELTLIIGARESSGLLYASEYERWRSRGIDVEATVDRADSSWHGKIGMVTNVLDRLPLRDAGQTILMTCGPEVMMWYTVQMALGRGLSAESLYVSLERNMNCAIGLCGHCQFGPEFLCKDGPVFRYDRVASILKEDDL